MLDPMLVAGIKGTKATLMDTRKTTPGLRALQKRAVQRLSV